MDSPEAGRRGGLFHPAWLVAALVFLFLRNVPFALRVPVNTFGDELGRIDCVMKLGRGHLPHPADFIERRLLRFLYQDTPQRYLPRKLPDPHWLASYTFQAVHPPLVPLLLLPWFKLFAALGLTLTWQIKLLRIVCLLPVAGGMWLIWRHAGRIGSVPWLASALSLPLLANDMYFAVNSDTFSLLFGAWALVEMARLIREPGARRRWVGLVSALFLALGTKVVNGLLLLPWGVMTLIQFRRQPGWRTLRRSACWLGAGLALSGGWYLLNRLNFGYLFWYPQGRLVGVFPVLPVGFNLATMASFFTAFSQTLLRGELFWRGGYFNALSLNWSRCLLTGVPALLYLLGAWALLRDRFALRRHIAWLMPVLWVTVPIGVYLGKPGWLVALPGPLLATGIWSLLRGGIASAEADDRLLLTTGLLLPLAMLAGHAWVGGFPYYHGRYSMALLPCLIGIVAAGWRTLPRPLFSPWLPVLALLGHNLAYAVLLFDRL